MTAVYATVPGTLLLAPAPPPTVAQPGRDCPACQAPRMAHDSWGAQTTGCKVGIVWLTGRVL